MQLIKIGSFFAVLSISQGIISCGRNVETTSYTRSSGANNDTQSEENAVTNGSQSKAATTRGVGSNTNVSTQSPNSFFPKPSGPSNGSNRPSVLSTVIGTIAQPKAEPQSPASNSPGWRQAISAGVNVIKTLVNKNNNNNNNNCTTNDPLWLNSPTADTLSGSSLNNSEANYLEENSTYLAPSFETSTTKKCDETLW